MQRLLCFFLLFSVASCGEWYECGMEWRPCEDIYANAEQRYVARRRGEEAQKIERVLPTRNRNKISIDVHCTAHSMRLCCLCVSCTLFYVGSAVFDDALKLHAVAGVRCHVWAFFACWLNMIFRRGKCCTRVVECGGVDGHSIHSGISGNDRVSSVVWNWMY